MHFLLPFFLHILNIYGQFSPVLYSQFTINIAHIIFYRSISTKSGLSFSTNLKASLPFSALVKTSMPENEFIIISSPSRVKP